MKEREVITAIIWLALGLTISIWSATFPFGSTQSPGPAYLPFGLGLCVIIISIIMLIQFLMREKGDRTPSSPLFPHSIGTRRVIFCLIGMVFSAAFLELLGFSLTMILMILFMMRTIEPQPWRKALFYSVGSGFGAFFLFKVLLQTQLPGGLLGF